MTARILRDASGAPLIDASGRMLVTGSILDENQSISRTPISLATITADWCANTYGTAPCTASGTPCYNTFATCQDKANYSLSSRDYLFSSTEAPQADTAARPYLLSVTYLPTEIRDRITVVGRVKLQLADEPDTDVGVDPYRANRAAPFSASYWRRWLARNPNYKGRKLVLSEGFWFVDQADFAKRWEGQLTNISIRGRQVTIEAVDYLGALQDVEIPAAISCECNHDITATAASFVVSDSSALDDAGYVRINDEVIGYTGRNSTTNLLSGCTRGMFDTVAAAHSHGDKVDRCEYFAPDSPYTHLQTLLVDHGGVATANIDTAAMTRAAGFPHTDVKFSALIVEQEKVFDLVADLAGALGINVWQDEAQMITVGRALPNDPARTTTGLTDAANLVEKSASLDRNEESRATRVIIYWDKDALGAADEAQSYRAVEVAVDADAESAAGYNEALPLTVYHRWLRPEYFRDKAAKRYIQAMAARMLAGVIEAQQQLSFELDRKDEALLTGHFAEITTDEATDIHGNDLAATWMVVKRTHGETTIKYQARQVVGDKLAIIAPAGHPDYSAATDDEKQYGYIADASGMMTATEKGYRIW